MQASLPFAAKSETSRDAAERMAAQPNRVRRDHESILNVLLSGRNQPANFRPF